MVPGWSKDITGTEGECYKMKYKPIEHICSKSSFPRLAALGIIFSKKMFWIWSKGVCVTNFRSLSFSIRSGGRVPTHSRLPTHKPTSYDPIKENSLCLRFVGFDYGPLNANF